jgi:hypothetical protein
MSKSLSSKEANTVSLSQGNHMPHFWFISLYEGITPSNHSRLPDQILFEPFFLGGCQEYTSIFLLTFIAWSIEVCCFVGWAGFS